MDFAIVPTSALRDLEFAVSTVLDGLKEEPLSEPVTISDQIEQPEQP